MGECSTRGTVRHRRFSEIRRPTTPDRRARITAIAARMEAAEWLAELRSAAGVTQAEIAGRLGVTQGNVSQLEARDDVLLSTLREYVAALGLELDIAAVSPTTGRRIPLGGPTAS